MSDTSVSPSDVLRAIFLSVKRRSFSRKQTVGQKIRLVLIVLAVFLSSYGLAGSVVALFLSLGVFMTLRWVHLRVFDFKGGMVLVCAALYSLPLATVAKGYEVLYKVILRKIRIVNWFPKFPFNDQTVTKDLTYNELHSRDTFWGSKMPRSFPSPNALTVIRALGSLVLIYFHSISAIVFFPAALLLSLTDLFDGVIARTQGRETVFGKWADPIADRMLLLSVAIFLYYRNPSFWSSASIKIIAPEVIFLLFFAIVIISRRPVVPRAVFWGRIKFVLYLFSVNSLLFGNVVLAEILLNVGCLFSWVATCSYITRFYQEMYHKSIFNGVLEWLATHSNRIQEELSTCKL
ncbi:MAG: CDP-alcohol phosphatidyltransferase family protein [bacterium]|nr:CDP-alcohol phosphatidyltransferase family protein [bacterium]